MELSCLLKISWQLLCGTDDAGPAIAGISGDGDQPLLLQGGGQIFDVLPGAAKKLSQLGEGHVLPGLAQHGQQHELFHSDLAVRPVKGGLEPVPRNEDGAEDGPRLPVSCVPEFFNQIR